MRSSRPLLVALLFAVIVLLAAAPAVPGQQENARESEPAEAAEKVVAATVDSPAEEETRRSHFVDTSTDRTPAKTAFPAYPRIARRDRIEGDATVCFKIDKRGRIYSVRVRDYSHRIFRRPALRAIRESTFEPLQPSEVLETARTCRTYRFRLEPALAANEQ